MKALIFNDKVVDVQPTEFDVHSSMTWVDCPDDCQMGSEYRDGAIIPIPGPTDARRLEQLRMQRNKKLRNSDWTQNRDVVLSNDSEWATYRQELRDITSTYQNVDDAVWPTEPS
jgi:hypothetical protein